MSNVIIKWFYYSIWLICSRNVLFHIPTGMFSGVNIKIFSRLYF